MFLASPSFFWNSPKRLTPNSASRMIKIDHQSPIASSERAIGQSSCSKLVRFTMAGSVEFDAFPVNRSRLRLKTHQGSITALCGCSIKPDALGRLSSLIMQPLGDDDEAR